MKVNIINWILSKIESGEIAENQVVAVYDKNNNIVYLGKANFAPLSLWDEFKTATIVGNELRINERQAEHETEPEHETRKTYGELKIGDVIYWYGALVRIVKINRVNCEKEDCTYFTIEPYNDETVQILGEFYSHGTYGGINKLSVTTIN